MHTRNHYFQILKYVIRFNGEKQLSNEKYSSILCIISKRVF